MKMTKDKKEKTVYDLDLHESMETINGIDGKMEITRVPGGWVYCFEYPGYRQAPIIFVPFVPKEDDLKGKQK